MPGLAPLGPILERGPDRLGGQAPTHRGLRRAGVHDRRAHAGALQLHLQVGDHRHQRSLRGAVGTHVRALAQRDVGAHEDQVTAPTLDHPREHRGGQPVGPDQVDLDLRFESRGVDFVQLAEVGVAGTGDQNFDVTELFGDLVHESLHRLDVGHIEWQGYRLTAVGADLVGDLLTLVDAPRT